MVSVVVVKVLLIILLLIEIWLLVLVLVEIVRGMILVINVSEVIRIGCKCVVVFCKVVVINGLLCKQVVLVNLIIKMVFFDVSLRVVSKVIWKQILFFRLCNVVVVIVLIIFNGIIIMIEKGID